jgi:hypothetical protein
MAEAVAALNLASNILQVIDFGTKFVSTAQKVYRTGVAALDNHDVFPDLRQINKDLGTVLKDLTVPIQDGVSEHHQGIIDLGAECGTLAQQLSASFRAWFERYNSKA